MLLPAAPGGRRRIAPRWRSPRRSLPGGLQKSSAREDSSARAARAGAGVRCPTATHLPSLVAPPLGVGACAERGDDVRHRRRVGRRDPNQHGPPHGPIMDPRMARSWTPAWPDHGSNMTFHGFLASRRDHIVRARGLRTPRATRWLIFCRRSQRCGKASTRLGSTPSEGGRLDWVEPQQVASGVITSSRALAQRAIGSLPRDHPIAAAAGPMGEDDFTGGGRRKLPALPTATTSWSWAARSSRARRAPKRGRRTSACSRSTSGRCAGLSARRAHRGLARIAVAASPSPQSPLMVAFAASAPPA